jgi:hypothetical protein
MRGCGPLDSEWMVGNPEVIHMSVTSPIHRCGPAPSWILRISPDMSRLRHLGPHIRGVPVIPPARVHEIPEATRRPTAMPRFAPPSRRHAHRGGGSVPFAGAARRSDNPHTGPNWQSYDFFFVHYKYTDSTGEDGNFDEKVRRIEELDSQIPLLLDLKPDVIVVTGDHSTPSALRGHSWHPVPVLLASATCRTDRATSFGESECLRGGLGQVQAQYLLPLALAHAGRLQKFGA